jgi:Fe-S oxidoreductase
MQALTTIETMNAYGVKKVVTTCPHCFNTIKNEYPSLGGNYEVLHHTQFLKQLLEENRIHVEGGVLREKRSRTMTLVIWVGQTEFMKRLEILLKS